MGTAQLANGRAKSRTQVCWLSAFGCFLTYHVANCLRMDTQPLWGKDRKTRKWPLRCKSSKWRSVCNLSGVSSRITLNLAQLEKRQFTIINTEKLYRNTTLSLLGTGNPLEIKEAFFPSLSLSHFLVLPSLHLCLSEA